MEGPSGWAHDGDSPVLHGGSAYKGDKQITMYSRMHTRRDWLLLQAKVGHHNSSKYSGAEPRRQP